MAGPPSLLSLLMKPRECAVAAVATPRPAVGVEPEADAAQTSPANLMHQFGSRKSADEMRETGASPISYVSGLLSASCRPAAADDGALGRAWPILPRDDFDEFGDHGDFALGDERAPASFPAASFLLASPLSARPVAARPSDLEPMFPLGDDVSEAPALAY